MLMTGATRDTKKTGLTPLTEAPRSRLGPHSRPREWRPPALFWAESGLAPLEEAGQGRLGRHNRRRGRRLGARLSGTLLLRVPNGWSEVAIKCGQR